MIYLDSFKFVPAAVEEDFIFAEKRNCFDTFYPFGVFPQKQFTEISFSDITILYGGNGSGKSTALNLISDKIGASRDTVYNRTNYFEDYLNLCKVKYEDNSYQNRVILTSDGVFDSMLDIRNLNQRIDAKREEVMQEYFDYKNISKYPEMFSKERHEEYEAMRRNPLANMDKFRQSNMAMTKTMSKTVRECVADNVREHSNGESAYEYFMQRIEGDGIYILDEPENSLSPKLQQELVKALVESVRYFNCQLIIATHSPFILAIPNARIYDLDCDPVDIRDWTELENVRAYFDFFKKHEMEFE